MRIVLVVSSLLGGGLLSQAPPVADPSGSFGSYAQTYGPFAPFAIVLLWIAWLLWKDNKAKDAQITALIERVLPAVTTSSAALNESGQAMRSMADRNLTHDEVRELREALDRNTRALARAGRTPR